MAAEKTETDGREPPRYEIRVRGPIGPTIMQAFPTLAMIRNGQDTLLTGPLPDQSALYGVIHSSKRSACSCTRSAGYQPPILERPARSRDPC
jgi:hypothetical protein